MLTKIGPFDVYELVGRGGMGSVYRGLDPVIGRPVAIKVIRLIGYNDGEEASFLRDRLFKEARAAGRLSHPGIVTIYQVGVQEDLAYIAMEYVDGPTLENCMASAGPLDPDLLSRALLGTAAALDYAHERAVIHRDIKPSNIMLTAAGVAKVTDFGIAKTMLGHTVSRTGALLGTPYYMSPEQVQGKDLDGRSDQFALAVIAYQMLTKRRPFHAEQVTSVCYQIAHVEPPSPVDLNPDLNSGVSEVLSRALSKSPADRFPTCMGFATSLIEEYVRTLRREPEQVNAGAGLPLFETPAAPSPPNRTKVSAPGWVPWAVVSFCVSAVIALFAARLFNERTTLPNKYVSEANNAKHMTAEPALHPVTPIQAPDSTTRRVLRDAGAVRSSRQVPQPQPEAATPTPLSPVELPEAKTTGVPAIASNGRLVWTGSVAAGTLITIENGQASVGTVNGKLPGIPVNVRVFPASTGAEGFTVFTADMKYATPVKEWTNVGPTTFAWDPRHSTDLFIWEVPNPANNWQKLVLRINRPEVAGCVVEWRSKAASPNTSQ